MAPLTKSRRQPADGHYRRAAPDLEQPRRQESKVVVPGVMYPSATPHLAHVTGHELQQLPPSAASEAQSAAVIFYDPMTSKGSHDLTQPRPSAADRPAAQESKHQSPYKNKPRTRAEAIEAVALELARLSLSTRPTRDALK